MSEKLKTLHFDDIDDGITVATIEDEIGTWEDAASFEDDLFHLMDRGDAREKILLSLQNVEFMVSTGFDRLISFAREFATRGGLLVICEMHPDVLSILAMRMENQDFSLFMAKDIYAGVEFLQGAICVAQ